MKKNHIYILLIFLPALFLMACEDNYNFDMDKLSKTTTAQTSIAMPLAYANLLLSDLIPEVEDTVVYNSDKSISIVFSRPDIFTYNVSEFFKIPALDPPASKEFVMGKLELADIHLTNSFTAKQLGMSYDGYFPVFPETQVMNLGPYTFEAVPDEFQNATFSAGQMSLTLTNNLPVAIAAGMEFQIRDKANGNAVVASFPFPNVILAGATAQSTPVDLNGKTFSNQMQAYFANIQMLSATNVTINSNANAFSFNLDITGIKVSSGSALISKIQLPHETREFDFGDAADELHYLAFKDGIIQIKLWSYVDASVAVKLRIPSFTKNGVVYEKVIDISRTNDTPLIHEIDLAGYECDLTLGVQKKFNTLVVEYDVYNTAPTEYVQYSETDRVAVELHTTDIFFSEARGKLKSQSITIAPTLVDLDVDLLDVFDGGFKLTDPRFNFFVANSVGIPVKFDFSMKGIATNKNEEVLEISHVLKTITPENPFAIDTIQINKNTSNIVDFIALPPAEIVFNTSVTTNPAGYEDVLSFVSDTSQVRIGVEMELPLEFQTPNLAIIDTVDISFDQSLELLDDANIEFYFKADNGFPFDIQLYLTPLGEDANGLPVAYTTINAHVLEAADVNSVGKVTTLKSTYNKLNLSFDDINNLVNAQKLIVHAKLMTSSNGTVPVKLFHDYSLAIKIGVKAEGSATINFE